MYESVFSFLDLSSISPSGIFLTMDGKKSLSDMILYSSMKLSIPVSDIDKNALIAEAKTYCEECKRRKKEEQIKERKRIKAENAYKTEFSTDLSSEADRLHRQFLMSLVPFVDQRDGECHFFDEVNRKIVDVKMKIFIAINGLENEKELISKSLIGYADFNPLNPSPHYRKIEEGREITVLNLCVVPKWISRAPTSKSIEGSLIHTLLLNLFPEEKSREFALCWAYHALTSRNHTYLSLVGSRGVGKGMFADLIGQLVGWNYYDDCNVSVLEGNFNAQFEKNRVLFFDEIPLDSPDKINKLKAYANNHISVEAKGKDARSIRNYTSCIIANNSLSGMHIGPEERRFSIVTIGKKDLKKVLPLKKVVELSALLEIDAESEPHEEIINFGHWLLENYKNPKYSNTHTYKEEYFYEISMNGLSDWKQFIISHLESNYEDDAPVFTKTLKKNFADSQGQSMTKEKIVFPQSRSLHNFLQEYKYRDEFTMGSMIDVKKEDNTLCKALVINPEFRQYLMNKNDKIDL